MRDVQTWDRINCPECQEKLSHSDVQQFASKVTFERYDNLALRYGMKDEPNFRWCPAPGCDSGQLHDEGDESPLIICINCRSKSCFTHQGPWHDGKTCLEVDNDEPSDVEAPPQRPKSRFSLWTRSSGSQEVVIGGVRRLETKQEKGDRKLAARLTKEQEKEERRAQRKQAVEEREAELQRRHQMEERARAIREEQGRKDAEANEIKRRRKREEIATQAMLGEVTKACPGRSCGWRIEKNQGCDHMTCMCFSRVPFGEVLIRDAIQAGSVNMSSAGSVWLLGVQSGNKETPTITKAADITRRIFDSISYSSFMLSWYMRC
ncbi:hypothetical protein MMC25_000999 [Agyrium rufum]|nr:hypothetical protein [Agyrium rufum]